MKRLNSGACFRRLIIWGLIGHGFSVHAAAGGIGRGRSRPQKWPDVCGMRTNTVIWRILAVIDSHGFFTRILNMTFIVLFNILITIACVCWSHILLKLVKSNRSSRHIAVCQLSFRKNRHTRLSWRHLSQIWITLFRISLFQLNSTFFITAMTVLA